MGLDEMYRTPVRPDVFREIRQRGETSFVGLGVSNNTLMLKKKGHTNLLKSYKQIISQIKYRDEADMDLEKLFEEEEEDFYEKVDIVEKPIQVNSQKRKRMKAAIDRDIKRPKQPTGQQYPEMVVMWYKYWSMKLNKAFLTDVPREFTGESKAPSLSEFMSSKSGDAILKYSKFISKQFI